MRQLREVVRTCGQPSAKSGPNRTLELFPPRGTNRGRNLVRLSLDGREELPHLFAFWFEFTQ